MQNGFFDDLLKEEAAKRESVEEAESEAVVSDGVEASEDLKEEETIEFSFGDLAKEEPKESKEPREVTEIPEAAEAVETVETVETASVQENSHKENHNKKRYNGKKRHYYNKNKQRNNNSGNRAKEDGGFFPLSF